MNRKNIFILTALVLFCPTTKLIHAAETIPLAGEWRFALDRSDVGTNENWFTKNLPDKIQLPGILEALGYGDEISTTTPWVLSLYDHFWFLRADYAAYTNSGSVKIPFLCQPPRHYLGAAWYQRDIEIPTNWNGKRVVLFLERPHWKSTVWLDDKEIGSDISLCTPHEFDFGLVPPGRHRLTIRVDNRMILPYRPDAHSVSDSLDNAWNGIVGDMKLSATSPVWIEGLQVYPHVETKSVTIKGTIKNISAKSGSGELKMFVTPLRFENPPKMMAQTNVAVSWTENGGTFQTEVTLRSGAKLWDEFDPTIYRLAMWFDNRDSVGTHFGLREFKAVGTDFEINGRKTYLRGTHFGGDFPLTGYPPTDTASWKKIFQTCKDYGLNHMRFHSWCPPEAAFTAADELGFYLQVECGMWNPFTPGGEMEKMLYAETERIIRAYGNHPSLMLISASNEAGGRWKQVLPDWVKHFRAEDPRHLYTPDTGWSLIDSPDQPINGGADYLAIGRVGPNRVRGERGWFGGDYGDSIAGVNVPVIAHELGQWVAYPDFDVIKKFTGFMHPGNYGIFRDSLAAHGLLEQNKKFAWASGRFQLVCYKEEIEANLRTPGMAGFQLLDLHDYTGQGTALVGLLDPFWESKGYATPEEFRKFCGPVIPLARLTKRVFTTADKFEVPVEMANYGAAKVEDAWANWRIENTAGKIISRGEFAAKNIPIGRSFPLGNVTVDLSKLVAPATYNLVVSTASLQVDSQIFENDWSFWLYPAQISDAVPTNVFVTSSWDDAKKKLSAGGKVLFQPRLADLDWSSPPLARVPVFWNALMGPTWSRMLGLWCDTNHPALAEFPTEANCDWQWTELIRNARAVNLDKLPRGLTPIVSAIDDWNRNYKLGVIFETKFGNGKLLVCSIDLDSRPGAQQLRRSLLDYMAGKKFAPQTEISLADFAGLHFDTRIMHKLGATAEADGQNANAILDGDPNTFWSSADARGNGPKHPHEIIVRFKSPTAMDGLVLMPRQNHREHQGDIRDYTIETSDDGTNWQQVISGQLPSTFDPLKVLFGKTITTKQFKLTALSGFGTDNSAALAELAVIYAGPKLADDNSGSIEYQRVRTASPDIDAGEAPAKPVKK
jgi:beta-galactosidase